MAFCSNCGQELSDAAPLCPKCGHPRAGAVVQATATRASEAIAKQNGFAIASLVLGVASFVVPIAGILTAIFAIVLGSRAKKEIRADPLQAGEGMAKAGVVLGWVWLGLAGIVVVVFLFALGVSRVAIG